MVLRRGTVALGLVVTVGAVAPAVAQTPAAAPEPLTITLTATPRVQTADFDRTIVLKGTVSGSEAVTAALAERSLELTVDATAVGYDRPLDIEPIRPAADGTFKRKLDAAINARITVSPSSPDRFSGTSPEVRTHWTPLPEIFNYTSGKRLVIEYSATIPGGLPFATGSPKVKRGPATTAAFYAGPTRSIRRIGTAPLTSDYDGQVGAKFKIPFKKLPPGGGRVYACVKGIAFLGTDPVDPDCGEPRSTGVIAPREP